MQTNSVFFSVRRRHLEHFPVNFITLKQIMHNIIKHPIRNTYLKNSPKTYLGPSFIEKTDQKQKSVLQSLQVLNILFLNEENAGKLVEIFNE